ncbi:MAG TPA: pyridoxal-dependent decarboxylase, partial [Polyangiaceae bacterium]|nr:pyridoxal-dependent decarboxylase [Polyangiaceae bacterium]
QELVEWAEPGLASMASPRFFGWVTGGSLPAAVAADWLTSAWDQNAGPSSATPSSCAFESCALSWVVQLLELPPDTRGAFVSGCSMANLTALAGARSQVLRSAGWDVEREGLFGAPAVRVFVGQERHESIDRALRLLGFGKRSIRFLATDAQGRLRSDALRAALLRGAEKSPVIVCAQLGNVNSGACDPLPELHEILEEYRTTCSPEHAWLHVDGAFGLWLRASPSLRALAAGAELADSWATDAHKVLQVPYDSGIIFTRHVRAQRRAMAIQGAYLSSGHEPQAPNGGALIPDLSRRARGFVTWAALRSLGRRGVVEWIDRAAALAQHFASSLHAVEGLRILNEVTFNQVVVEATAPALARGSTVEARRDFTARWARAIQAEGTTFATPTLFQGRPALRLSVMNADSTERDIERSARAIRDVYRRLVADDQNRTQSEGAGARNESSRSSLE